MKVRRFTAATMQKALKTVRDEMGPDAVILSNHRVKGGVEIIVAQNYEPKSAHRVAPVYNEDPTLPEPKFSKKTAAKAPQTEESPWPFLSEAQQQEVQDQLRLQDQLEALKHKRSSEQEQGPNKAAVEPGVATQDELKAALSSIKQSRQEGSPLAPTAIQPAAAPKAKQTPNKLSAVPPQNPPAHERTRPLHEPVEHVTLNEVSQEKAQRKAQYNRQLIENVRGELQDLKELLISGNGAHASKPKTAEPEPFVWKKYAPKNALQVTFWQRLEQMGFGEPQIHNLVQSVVPDADDHKAWQAILRDLTQHINTSPSDKLKRGGVYALVGPTGAGKTTTIAKMAVRYVLEHEGHQVGLITMDNYRLAAHDQLKTLGQILGVPVQVADEEHSLSGCIDELSDCDLILIDTAGLTPNHPMLSYQLEQLALLKTNVNTLLTLPVTSHSRVLRKVYHTYKAAGLTGCVLTKIDEASCLGDAVSILLETEIPLSYYTDGQRIPDDIHVANAKALVRQTVQIAQQEQQQAKEQQAFANHG